VHRTLEIEASDAGPMSGAVLVCADQQAGCIRCFRGAASNSIGRTAEACPLRSSKNPEGF
jgi:hypothetical protein